MLVSEAPAFFDRIQNRSVTLENLILSFFSDIFRRLNSLWPQQRAGAQEPAMEQLCSLSWPWRSPAHHSPARPGFSVGRIAVSLVRQPGALGRWQGARASGRGPLKSHLRGATPTRPLRWRLFWASPEAARLPFLEQQQSRPHAVASGKWGGGRFLLYFQSKHHELWENFYICTRVDLVIVEKLFVSSSDFCLIFLF